MTTTRRGFLATTAGLAILPGLRSPAANPTAAAPPLNIAIFGNKYNAGHLLPSAHVHNIHIVALCDPHAAEITAALKKWQDTADQLEKEGKPEHREWIAKYRAMARGEGVEIHNDFQTMLITMGDRIDAVVVSHFDHLHRITCQAALRAGKPVFSERPLGRNIAEARALRSLAKETGLPTSYRSPGTAHGEFRRAIELVAEGAIGQPTEVHLWFDRGGPDRPALPQGTPPIPEGLSWAQWLGPLPPRDYHPDWMAYAQWRELSSGGIGTFGPHTAIFPFLALRMPELWARPCGAEPIRVTAECSSLNRISFPKWEIIRWQIPARGTLPAVEVVWHHGPGFPPGSRDQLHAKLRPFGIDTPAQADDLMKTAGSLIIGSEGALLGNDHSTQVTALPAQKFVEIETRRPLGIPQGRNIYHDWIEACRGGTPHILADFHHGGTLSELLMLGNIATLYPGETLSYDPHDGRITSHPEANSHLGFDLP
jgi:hypothetical protein